MSCWAILEPMGASVIISPGREAATRGPNQRNNSQRERGALQRSLCQKWLCIKSHSLNRTFQYSGSLSRFPPRHVVETLRTLPCTPFFHTLPPLSSYILLLWPPSRTRWFITPAFPSAPSWLLWFLYWHFQRSHLHAFFMLDPRWQTCIRRW